MSRKGSPRRPSDSCFARSCTSARSEGGPFGSDESEVDLRIENVTLRVPARRKPQPRLLWEYSALCSVLIPSMSANPASVQGPAGGVPKVLPAAYV